MSTFYSNTRKYSKVKKPEIKFQAVDVWAASSQAYAINGSYVKYVPMDSDTPKQKTNRQIVDYLLNNPSEITKQSYKRGEEVRRYFKALTFKILQGKLLNDFQNNAMQIAERDEITSNYELSVITSLPATYEKSAKRDEADRKINNAKGGYLGSVGTKVTIDIEVVKKVYSSNYGVYFITGITNDEKVIFFAYKKEIEVNNRVKVKGTIKALRDDSTQLNRVKVIA